MHDVVEEHQKQKAYTEHLLASANDEKFALKKEIEQLKHEHSLDREKWISEYAGLFLCLFVVGWLELGGERVNVHY